jgi:hypothetical protein
VFLLCVAAKAQADTLYYVYQTMPVVDQHWLSPSNWFTLDGNGNPTVPANRVPGPTDTAVLRSQAYLSGSTHVGTVEVTTGRLDGDAMTGGTLTVDTLTMQGEDPLTGFPAGPATLGSHLSVYVTTSMEVIAGAPLAYHGGNLLAGTLLHIQPGAIARIHADPAFSFSRGILTVQEQTAIFNDGTIILRNMARLETNGYGGNNLLANEGGTISSSGPGFAFVGENGGTITIDNYGTIRADAGSLSVIATTLLSGVTSGSLVTGTSEARIFAAVNIPSSATVNITGPGIVSMPGPGAANTVIINGTVNVGAVVNGNDIGGNLAIAGFLDGSGTITVRSPTISGSSTLDLTGASVGPIHLVIQHSGSLTLNNTAFSGSLIGNQGVTTWTGAGGLAMNDRTIFNNDIGGEFRIENDQTMFYGGTVGGSAFFNLSGTVRKTGGTGVTDIFLPFENVGGGALRVLSGTLRFEDRFQQSSGTTDLIGGSIVAVQGFDLSGGSLTGSGNFTGDIRNTGGTISPGNSPGAISIAGNYTQGAGGTLKIEIAGLTTAGVDYDLLAVTGTATLGGALRVSDINGFTPGPTDTVVPLTAGSITGTFSSANAQVTYGSTSLTVGALATPLSQLLNISTRLRVLTGENVLIGGFIITGTDPKRVIIRGIGPSLTGVGATLADPTLELHQGNTTIATNDNWKIRPDGSSQQAEIEATTIPPTNDLESALVATLNPGAYTAILADKNGTTGVGLVEVYDLTQAVNSQVANISTRGFVDTGDQVMIGGVIVGPNTTASSRVLVRAIGPSLQNVGIANALQDPTLELHNGSGMTIATNDNWKTRSDGGSQQAEIEATTIPPTNDLESALLEALAPGNYTAIVRGTNNTTGVALVEVYNLQ